MLLFTHITKYSQILQACFQFPALPIHLQHTALGVCLYLQVFSVPGKVNLAVCYRKDVWRLTPAHNALTYLAYQCDYTKPGRVSSISRVGRFYTVTKEFIDSLGL